MRKEYIGINVWDDLGLPIRLVAVVNYHNDKPMDWAVYAGLNDNDITIRAWGKKLQEEIARAKFPMFKDVRYRQ